MPPTPETFHIIHDEALRLKRLVEDLRTLSLAETGELLLVRRPTSPQAILERAVTTHATRAQQREISLHVEASSDLPDVNADPDRMAQVLDNLLDNALRHTPDGERITLGAERKDGSVLLSVQDSGPGIAEEDRARLFDRFYRADRSRQRHEGGSGLGLAIARSIVIRHGGRIWVESKPGQGARFIIELPVSVVDDREEAG